MGKGSAVSGGWILAGPEIQVLFLASHHCHLQSLQPDANVGSGHRDYKRMELNSARALVIYFQSSERLLLCSEGWCHKGRENWRGDGEVSLQ